MSASSWASRSARSVARPVENGFAVRPVGHALRATSIGGSEHGMDSYKTVTVPSAPLGVRAARHATRAWLDDAGVDGFDGLDDTMLVVAELVTNAVVHGAPPIVLHLWREIDGIRVGVSDRNPSPGAVQPSATLRPSGLGLRIVDRLADRWGSAAHDAGKIVWA